MASANTRERRSDVVIAASTAVVALGLLLGAPALSATDAGGPTDYPAVFSKEWILFGVVLLVQAAVLIAARRHPRTTLTSIAVLAVIGCALSPGDLHTTADLAVVIAVFLIVVRVPIGRLWLPLSATFALVVIAEVTADAIRSGGLALPMLAEGFLQAIGTVGLPLLVALFIRSQREVRSARGAEVAAIIREQEALVDVAVSRERAAMARELHDIAAHHLSGIALMAAVIDRQIDAEPARAHEGARQVREQSIAVLEDLRRLVGLLRDDAPAERSVETVAGILDLVERARADIRLDVLDGGDGVRLGEGAGPLAQLAAYRTVQEALTNAALHAPGAARTVTIDDRSAERVTVRIDNGPSDNPATPTSTAGGNGLRGMRERADLVGAGLEAGPTRDGGWRVELVLTREAPAAAEDFGLGGKA